MGEFAQQQLMSSREESQLEHEHASPTSKGVAGMSRNVNDSALANSQQRDRKALSTGGEKSYYTTIVWLLLALGERLEIPFCVLDEFDVFLEDPVTYLQIDNRWPKQPMQCNIIINAFIFITTQDVSNVKVDPMRKVVKMKPPARNK
jgi:hypothetical protein